MYSAGNARRGVSPEKHLSPKKHLPNPQAQPTERQDLIRTAHIIENTHPPPHQNPTNSAIIRKHQERRVVLGWKRPQGRFPQKHLPNHHKHNQLSYHPKTSTADDYFCYRSSAKPHHRHGRHKSADPRRLSPPSQSPRRSYGLYPIAKHHRQ